MTLEHPEFLHLKLSQLAPGFILDDAPDSMGPEITWEMYRQTIALLRRHPEVSGDEWPLYAGWKAWCLRHFGYLPTGGETLDGGRLQTWARWEVGLRRMVASFDKHGYKPPLATGDEENLRAVIDARGRILLHQGNKRAALLFFHFGPDYTVDVKISGRDPKWEAVTGGLYAFSGKPVLYQPYPHPDVQAWAVAQPCWERLDMIREFCPNGAGSVLDIGCHTGWFCRALAEPGCRVRGVEKSAPIVLAAEVMSNFLDLPEDRRPQYVVQDSAAYLASTEETFDTCLYLSLVMHTFVRPVEEAWAELNAVSQRCRRMFLDCVWGAYASRLPFTNENIGETICAHTQFTNYKLLGQTLHEDRPFYVFWRES